MGSIKLIRDVSVVLLMTLVLQSSWEAAHASPSFDCNKATTWSEKQICSDTNLENLDRSLADAFSSLMENLVSHGSESKLLQTEQRRWLEGRDKHCKPSGPEITDMHDANSCLKKYYQDRISLLNEKKPHQHAEDSLGRNALEIISRDKDALIAAQEMYLPDSAPTSQKLDAARRAVADAARQLAKDQGALYRYKVIYEGDHELCERVVALYNQLLKEEFDELIREPRFSPDNGRVEMPSTDFEVKRQDAFTQIGLDVPSSSVDGDYNLNLFDDGGERSVRLQNQDNGKSSFTMVSILENDSASSTSAATERSFAKHNFFGDEQFVKGLGYVHFLKKWPNFDRLYKSAVEKVSSAPNGVREVPLISAQYLSTGFFVDKRVGPIFISNSATVLGPYLDPSVGSLIDVYKLTSKATDDICYLTLTPTNLTDSKVGDNHE